MCVRLKSLISSGNQENGKSDNTAFFQMLLSFYIQSEVGFSFISIVPPHSPISHSLRLKLEWFDSVLEMYI